MQKPEISNGRDTMSHMPFLTYDRMGNRILLFCQADDSFRWKIYVSVNDGKPLRIETDFPVEMIECSPAAWQDETGWHLTFIAGGKAENPLYHLYRMDGESFEKLSQPVAIRPTRTGFIYLDRLVVGAMQDAVHVHDPDGDHTIELPGAYIYRVSYRADQADTLLITGQWIGEEEFFSIEYDLTTSEQRLMECDGVSAYKPTIYGNEILYAERTGDHFEERRIRKAERHHLQQCRMAFKRPTDDMAMHRNRTKKCRCADPQNTEPDSVRPSCLECIEKHLGAAMVILSEIHDGYSYRLQFIGHLNEAAEESQEFPTLHDMIRQSRKEYQRDATIPNWEALAGEIDNVRRTS